MYYDDQQEFCHDGILEVVSETAGKKLIEQKLLKLYQKRLAEYGSILEDV